MMKKLFFDDDWKNWIWSNIKNGVSKQRIYDDLIDAGYDVFTIIMELRFIPAILRKKDETPVSLVMQRLQEYGATKLDTAIPLYQIKSFLSAEECAHIIAIQKEHHQRSQTGQGKDSKINEIRVSYSTFLEQHKDPLVQHVKERISSTLGIPTQYSEPIQGQWYQKEGFYKAHFDASQSYDEFRHFYGNRTWTCMVTLNDVIQGGDTYFSKLDIRFKPEIGQALIWYNLGVDGLAHPLTLHGGEPIIQGEKFILTQWFHQCT